MTRKIAHAIIAKIESYWAEYRDVEMRQDVSTWIEGAIDDTPDATSGFLKAIKEHCPIRFGPPDLATTKEAVLAWEKETGIRLRRGRSTDYIPIEPTEEERMFMPILCAEAQSAGVDVSKDGWLFRYMLTPEARTKHETKRREGRCGGTS